MPVVGEHPEHGRQLGLRRVVQPAGRLVEQEHGRGTDQHHDEGQGQPLALGEVARMGVVGDVRDESVEELAGLPRAAVGCQTLLGDGLEVEQVGGGLRHQSDEGAAPGRRLGRRVGAGDLDASGPALAAALEGPEQRRLAGPVASHQSRHGAGPQADARALERHLRATDHGESLAHRHRRAVLREGGGGRCAEVESAGQPPCVAHGHRQGSHRRRRPSSVIGGTTGETARISAGSSARTRRRR